MESERANPDPQTELKRLEGSIANLDKAVHAARKTLDGRWVKTLRVIAGQADLTTLSTQVGILKLDLPAFAAMATANKKDLDVDRFRAQFNALETKFVNFRKAYHEELSPNAASSSRAEGRRWWQVWKWFRSRRSS